MVHIQLSGATKKTRFCLLGIEILPNKDNNNPVFLIWTQAFGSQEEKFAQGKNQPQLHFSYVRITCPVFVFDRKQMDPK